MNINKKIRRAFQRATPDVLGTLSVHDAPKPVQKRRKLSDRAVEFIATAASLALLISAVGGGFAYYRNSYAGNTGTGAVPTTTTQKNAPAEPDDTAPWSTDPEPTVPADSLTPQALIAAAEAIVCPEAQENMESRFAESTYDGKAAYQVSITYKGYEYTFHFCASSAALLNIEIPHNDAIKEDIYITPTVAQQIGLLAASEAHRGDDGTLEVTACELMEVGETVYLLNIAYQDNATLSAVMYSYYIDPYTGQIIEAFANSKELARSEIRDIALSYAGTANFSDVKHLEMNLVSAGAPYYHVILEYDIYRFELDIDLYTGSISNDTKTEIGHRPDEALDAGNIGIATAKDIAYNHAGVKEAYVFGFSYTFEEDQYHLRFTYEDLGDQQCEYTIDAKTGKIVSFRYPGSGDSDAITALEARDIALAAANADLAEVYYLTVAFCADQVLGFEATDDPLYCVCLEFSTYSYTVIIDSATGDILDCQSIDIPGKHDDPGLIGWASARDAALKAAGISLDRLAHLYCSYDGSGAYDVQFMCNSMGHNSNLYTYRIDAYTSDVMTDEWIPEIPEVGSEFCTPKDAINHALNTAVYGDTDFVHIECIQVGSEQGRCFYLVIMENYLYCMIDANTMQHLDVSAPFPTDVLDQHTAAKQAIRVVGADEWDDWMLMLKGVYSDGQPYYCFLYDYEGVMHVCVVDAYTGDLLATATHQWILGHAADIPMYAALQHLGLTLEDVTDLEYEYDTVTDPEYPRHWICFRHNGQSYRIAVGGHVKTRLQILEVQTEKIG